MSLYTKARKHINMDRVKELHEKKITERIALQEQQYLFHFTQNFVPKHYDWRTGKFNENSLSLMQVNDIVLKRLEEIDDALSEGMTTKNFSYLYGGVVTHDIVALSPNLVSSTFAHDLISASSEVTSHMFGPDFPGSHINSIGDFGKPESLSKVDAQAHITTNHDVTPNEGEMAHPEKHVFTYQSEGNSIKWPTEFTLPDSFNDDLMWFDAQGNPQEWIHYIWPVHGHPGNYTPLNSSKDDSPYWYSVHPHNDPGSAWGHNSETNSDDKFRLRMTFNDGRIDRRSITDTSFDVTYGAARSIDSTAFDLTGNMHSTPFALGYETDYNLDANDTAALNALRLQWEKPRTETGHEDWQYIRSATATGYIDQLYGIDFPFAEYDYSPYESDHDQFTGTDGWTRIHPNLNTDASFAKKIIKNVQVGDKISFSYKWYSDAWLYNTENYADYNAEDYIHDGVRYGDHDWNPSYFRAVIGANNKAVSIKDQFQLIGADPSLTLTDGTYTIPPLPNPNNPEDNDLYMDYNITKKDNGFSFPYNGTYEYTVQEGDIDAAGLFQFTTILLAESTNLEYVQVTNFAHTIGDRTREKAGQLGKTTDAYNLGTSVASLDPNSKKKKKKDEEEETQSQEPQQKDLTDQEKYQENKKKKDKEEQERRKNEQERLKKEMKSAEVEEEAEEEESAEEEKTEIEDENDIEKEDKKKEAKPKPKKLTRQKDDRGHLLPLPGEQSDKWGLWLPKGKTEFDYHYYRGHRYPKGSLTDTGIPIGYMGRYVGTDRYGRDVDVPYTFKHRPGWAYSALHVTSSNENMRAKLKAHYDAIKEKYRNKPDSFWRSQPYHLSTPWMIAISTPFPGARPYVAKGEEAPIDENPEYNDGPLDIRDFVNPSDFDAYKAGGGNAARKDGKSVEDIIAQGRKNLESSDSDDPYSIKDPVFKDKDKDDMKKKLEDIIDNPKFANRFEKFGTQAKVYIDYLLNRLPNEIDNKYLGKEYVNGIFKDAWINEKGNISVGDNVVGTGGKASYDPKTKQITIPFNYDFDKNEEEIRKNPERLKNKKGWDKFIIDLAMTVGGEYGLDSAPVPIAGRATWLAKQLGGGQHRSGKVTMSADKLEKINPVLHAQIVGLGGKKIKEQLYPGQPSPNGFPDTPPPKMINGRHPEYGKQAKRYRKLDPVSAVVMNKVKTDDPETNKLVAAAAKKPKVQLVPNTRNKKDKVSEAVWPKGLWSKAKRHW